MSQFINIRLSLNSENRHPREGGDPDLQQNQNILDSRICGNDGKKEFINRPAIIKILLLTLLATTQLCFCQNNKPSQLAKVSGELVISSRIDFGTLFIGQTLNEQIELLAHGNQHITIVGMSANHPDIIVPNNLELELPIGFTQKVPIQWTPTLPGDFFSEIRVYAILDQQEVYPVPVMGVAIAIPNCDDNNECTHDNFNLVTESCEHSLIDIFCDDRDLCTENDRCVEGVCRGTAKTCFDGVDCTIDGCAKEQGCVFVPDPSLCSDDNPCTIDKCHPLAGCSWENAPAFTSCGSIDCDIAHFCVKDQCKEYDVSGQSDGWDCSDGNPCTKKDQCQQGKCKPSITLPATPQLLVEHHLYGGPQDWLATDGTHFLFSSAKELIVTNFETNGLSEKNRQSGQDGLRPLMVDQSLFLFITKAGQLNLLDVSNPQTPIWLWTHTLVDPDPWSGTFDLITTLVSHASPTTAGPIFSMCFSYWNTADLKAEHCGVFLLPWAPPNLPSAPLIKLLSLTSLANDLDSQDLFVGVSETETAHWLEIDDNGAVLNETSGLWPSSRISVHNQNLAGAHNGQVFVINTSSWLVSDEFSIFSDWPITTEDVALSQDWLFYSRASTPTGIFAFKLGTSHSAKVVPKILEAMPASEIAIEANHLLLHGDLALPLLLSMSADEISTTRVTGIGHGYLQTVVDGPEKSFAMLGTAAVGILAANGLDWQTWRLRWNSAATTPPWVIRGFSLDRGLDNFLPTETLDMGINCQGQVLEIIRPGQIDAELPLCSYGLSLNQTVTANRLWAYGLEKSVAENSKVYWLRAWELDGDLETGNLPVIDVTNPFVEPDQDLTIKLGAASFDEALLAINIDPENNQVILRKMKANAGALSLPEILTVPCPTNTNCQSATEPSTFSWEGDHVLRAEPTLLELINTTVGYQPSSQPRLILPTAFNNDWPLVLWLHGSRAWVAWKLTDTPAQWVLRQIQVSANALSIVGDLTIAGPITSTYEQGDLAVFIGGKTVTVVTPGCVP